MKVGYMTGSGSKDLRGIAWFCSEECKQSWQARLGGDAIAAIAAIHNALAKVKKAASVGDARRATLTEQEIEAAWRQAESREPLKDIRLINEEDNEDTLLFLLDGILACKRDPTAWIGFLSLNPTLAPYQNEPSLLASHIRLYDFLRVHLPQACLDACTPVVILALITREAGNSFGIWEQGVEDDGEMLGYGSWVESSFFNHSCEANMKKRIDGPVFDFYSLTDVKAGDELRINYIGDAKDASRQERQDILQKGWAFQCQCGKCLRDASTDRIT